MLLDHWLPDFDVRIRTSIQIAASTERVYASLRTANFDYWGITRVLYALRALPALPETPRETWRRILDDLERRRLTLNDMLAGGFAFLGERPNEELVLGAVGRFWRARGEMRETNPKRFLEPAPTGTAKAAWSFAVVPYSEGVTELLTETRVSCANDARGQFRAYWFLIKPFSWLIRREMLAAVRSTAERPVRRIVYPPKSR
jgi:hypothetical protein